VVLSLSQDGACTDSFENLRENSLKGDLSNDITINPPLFSLVNTFKVYSSYIYVGVTLVIERHNGLRVFQSTSAGTVGYLQ
jgi:hypothetical protein